MSQRLLRIIIITLFALVMAGMIALFQIGVESEKMGTLTPVGGDVGGPYTLVDQDGKTVTDKDFTATYKLIYFGFTYCPAICPTELSKMAKAMDLLGTAARAVQPMFISLDPERDAPENLKKYVPMFDDRLIGLTGSPAQVKAIADEYKIYYAKVQDEAANDYTIDHSSYIYFMSPDDQLLHIFKTEDTAEQMAALIQAWLTQGAAE